MMFAEADKLLPLRAMKHIAREPPQMCDARRRFVWMQKGWLKSVALHKRWRSPVSMNKPERVPVEREFELSVMVDVGNANVDASLYESLEKFVVAKECMFGQY